MKKLILLSTALLFVLAGFADGRSESPSVRAQVERRTVIIYGSSPAAISAAVQARRMGTSCLIVSPETRIGGLTTGGLGQTDIGNKAAFGGIGRSVMRLKLCAASVWIAARAA